jgi:hypothetical protein
LREALSRRVCLVPMDQVSVVPAALGADSGLKGAAALAMNTLADNAPGA